MVSSHFPEKWTRGFQGPSFVFDAMPRLSFGWPTSYFWYPRVARVACVPKAGKYRPNKGRKVGMAAQSSPVVNSAVVQLMMPTESYVGSVGTGKKMRRKEEMMTVLESLW
jgi:hypothetical protein